MDLAAKGLGAKEWNRSESVVKGKSEDLGGRRIIKKKTIGETGRYSYCFEYAFFTPPGRDLHTDLPPFFPWSAESSYPGAGLLEANQIEGQRNEILQLLLATSAQTRLRSKP